MKRCKRRIKINYKRFILSLTIFVIIAILITNVSKQIFANYYVNEKTSSTKEAIASECIDEKSGLHSQDDKSKEQEDLKDVNEVDKAENVDNLSKPNDYKEVFKEDLFLGDSITDSLSFYEFLEDSQVIAEFGLTSKGARNIVDNIVKKNPRNIFIMFGMNDILTNETSGEFADNYTELIHDIKLKLPDSNIYVQSILPVDSKVKNKKPLLTNENIENFNQALMNMAKDEDIKYLNIRTIIEEDKDLIEPDGIHVKYEFYKLWLNYLIENIK